MTEPKGTTKVGYVNTNGQVVIRNTGKPGVDHNQKVYQLGCSRCGHVMVQTAATYLTASVHSMMVGSSGLSF